MSGSGSFICDYCAGATPRGATRCESCGAAVMASSSEPSASPLLPLRPIAEWSLKSWVILAIALLLVGPFALVFGFMFVALALGALINAPAIVLLAFVVTVFVWRGGRRRAQ